MFPKNARVYKITESIFDDSLFESLGQFAFTPCASQEAIKTGFAEPVPYSSDLAVNAKGYVLLAMKTQEKVLPPAVIAEELAPKIAELQQEKGRPLSRKEKQVLKEELVQTLLPRAFVKSKVVNAFYCTKTQHLVVGTNSASVAETFLGLLRKALGSLSALPAFDNHQLNQQLHFWTQGKNLPEGFALGAAVEFVAPDEEGAKAKFDHHLISADEVQSHLQDKLVKRLELEQEGKISFVVKDDGSLSKIKYSDILANQNDELGWDDVQARVEADAILGCTTLINAIETINKNIGVNDAKS